MQAGKITRKQEDKIFSVICGAYSSHISGLYPVKLYKGVFLKRFLPDKKALCHTKKFLWRQLKCIIFLQKGTTVTLAIIRKYTSEPEKQPQKQRIFARISTAHAQNFAKCGTSGAMNQKKNFFRIAGAAITAAIISKSQKNILGGTKNGNYLVS